MNLQRNFLSLAMAIALVVGSTSALMAGVFVYEGFDYDAGALTGSNGGTGWIDPWSPNGSHDAADVSVGSASYTDDNGNSLVTSGNRATFSTAVSNPSGFRSFDLSGAPAGLVENGKLGKDGTSVWMSFLWQAEVEGAKWGGISLYDGPDGADNRLDVGQKSELEHGMGFPGSPTPSRVASTVPLGELSLLVVRLDFHELTDADPQAANNGQDEIYMWVNPDLDSTPADGDALYLPFRRRDNAADQSPTYMLDRMRIMKGGNGSWTSAQLDEIRLGETYADVTPFTAVPEPSTLVLLGLGLLGLAGRRKHV